MRIAVIGTGMVGRVLAAKLAETGHEVTIGTRDVEATLARTEPDQMGAPPFSQWRGEHPDIGLATMPDAAAGAELVVNATAGRVSLEAFRSIGAERLDGKIVLDVAQPLDLSRGLPPTLTVVNTDSLAEQLQRELPGARVVKSLNTTYAEVMVNPARVPGHHNIFVAGDDEGAKRVVRGILGELGWPEDRVIDLGDITGARAAEMFARMYFTLVGVLGTFDINIAVLAGGRKEQRP
ncbi:NADPH-dependent F420 reductase [Actinomyces israelii]|uniref:NADPH-dependent F420 reductase n=1 Tax=Actinomyces israelii TaxID=1659 RepID=UPI0005B88B4D|nr:NAD(P)-binding domain-containing protein [Actinomyces israelii]